MSDEYDPYATPEYAEIKTHFNSLFVTRHRVRAAGLRPTAVTIPARLKPPDRPEATDTPDTLFGLPVAWSDGECWGLVVGEGS
jgi:hypothetical protein